VAFALLQRGNVPHVLNDVTAARARAREDFSLSSEAEIEFPRSAREKEPPQRFRLRKLSNDEIRAEWAIFGASLSEKRREALALFGELVVDGPRGIISGVIPRRGRGGGTGRGNRRERNR